jgi:hypothetical protein
MTKAAILFRGISYSTRGQYRPWAVDWKPCLPSQRTYLIDPLRGKFDTVDVVLCSYHNKFEADILADYEPVEADWAPGSTQKQTFLRGLRLLRQREPYDLIITCRFDLELLTDVTALDYRPDCINFLWREWNQWCWEDHRRVADAIHILDGKLLDAFYRGVEDSIHEHCLHLVWNPIAVYSGRDRLNTISNHFINSNSLIESNPIYKFIRA